MYLKSGNPVEKVYRGCEVGICSNFLSSWQMQLLSKSSALPLSSLERPCIAVGYFVTYQQVTSLGGS